MSQEVYRLRKLEENDLELVLRWRNSERIRINMFNDKVITLDEHIGWFHRIQDNPRIDYQIFLMNQKPVGVVCFTEIDEVNQKCHWGFYLGETEIPRGTGNIMGFYGLKYIFETRQMRKVSGEVLVFNEKSVRFHERLGFRKEGYFVEHIMRGNQFLDVVSFAHFNKHWQSIKDSLQDKLFQKE